MPKYLVTANVLRIRSGPGMSHPVIGALFRNNIVQGDEINGDWVPCGFLYIIKNM